MRTECKDTRASHRKKRIGIGGNLMLMEGGIFPGYGKSYVNDDYVQAVASAGGVPMILPVTDEEDIVEAQIEAVDGLVISGGWDVDPLLWGEEPHEKLGSTLPVRDTFDRLLIAAARRRGLPILGICRRALSFGAAALLIFYAFTGFEAIAEAAEDMDDPKRNIPRAIVVVMLLVSAFYFLIMTVSIGVLGPDLAATKTPIATAAAVFLGTGGGLLVTAGTLVSIGGINLASSFLTPRVIVAIADDHMLPLIFSRYNRFHTPCVAILFATLVGILIALSGSFTTLAAISVVSRFAQYVPTCLAILVLRRRDPEHPSTLPVPFGPVIPVIAVLVSLWLLVQADLHKILFGLGGLLIAVPFYFLMRKQYLQR
ncbi:amino acid permease [uncultured Mitsuokella sp.]|uniref:amino acid permease n=1 Tax=uncultured Mitsuokella sp. TaxID=453120 RepID=UPI00258D3370|nr:amino acid permease [uncultured Mitsuokella sp.]